MIEVNGKIYKHTTKLKEFNGKETMIGESIRLPNGIYPAKITAFDMAGNKTEHELELKVLSGAERDIPPKVEFELNGKQFTSAENSKLMFNSDALSLTGKTTSASHIEIKDANGKVIGSTQADNGGNWRISLPKTSIPFNLKQDEEIKFTVTAQDLIGRETHLNFNLVYDIQPPEITAELEDVLSLGHQTNDNTPTLSGQTKANATVTIIIDGKTYQLTVVDAAGNHTEQHGSLTVDTQAPTLAEDTPLTLTNLAQPRFSGETEAGLKVTLEIDGKHYHNTADQDGKWQIHVGDALSEGIHDYQLTVVDAAGNHTEQRGLLTVDTQKTPSGVNQPPAKDHVMDAIPLDMVSTPEEQDNYF
ncbi:group 3 Ig-like protein [Providencia alcalifaciens R90-1475]|nr:group 3 Ig-like protein [Providencia alcalifaciens R90-1475]